MTEDLSDLILIHISTLIIKQFRLNFPSHSFCLIVYETMSYSFLSYCFFLIFFLAV